MLVVLVLLAAVSLLLLAVRRRTLTRERGTFDCSVRVGGRRWTPGVARVGSSRVEWWRVVSLWPRPSRTWGRGELDVVHRAWRPSSGAGSTASGVVLRCDHRGVPVELAMSQEAYTGFASWLEAAPPGASRIT